MKTLIQILAIGAIFVTAASAQETVITPVETPTLTLVERRAQGIERQANAQYRQLIVFYNRLMRDFWKSPDATPQEIADALGPKAGNLFQLGGLLANLIVTAQPENASKLIQPTNAIQVNPDGTVTVLDTPYTPPTP